MDSEHSAFITAQHKHHRYMIFGKKQRYIEVFQCSGEDMNLVLTGGMPTAVSPAKAAPALLSPGMLHNIAPLPPPTNIPPPPPANTTVGQLSQNLLQTTANAAAQINWDNSPLLAQQQAHMIAQQNLIARQTQAAAAQNEHFMLMHNLAVLNQNMSPMSPNSNPLQNSIMKAPPPVPMMPHLLPQQQPFVLLPRMAPLGVPRPHTIQYPLIPATPGVIPVMSNVAVKRSYGDAFIEQNSPAKRAFHHPQQLHSMYPQFYPNI